ncbi:MAG: hypothetical protein QOE82_3241, partial [Thermoanaerobaculia bacterium]|nr:hypothetical protein [Thermoanaerobaculia bacterium]
MKRVVVLAIAALLLPLIAAAANPITADDFNAIRGVLDKQAAAWNRGDING